MKNKKFWFFLALTVLAHIALFVLKTRIPATKVIDGLQQEHFIEYTQSIKTDTFPEDLGYFNTRFFPGLPLLMLVPSFFGFSVKAAGLLVGLLSLILIYWISYKLTKDSLYSFLITIFPPIVFEMTSKISTETVIVAFSLIFYWLVFKHKKYFYASLLAGFGVIVRPVFIVYYVGLFIYLLKKKAKKTVLLQSLTLFIIFPWFLSVFNLLVLERGVFYQQQVYTETAGVAFGLWTFVKEIFSTADFRILVSSLAYFAFSLWLLIVILRREKNFLFKNDRFFVRLWAVLVFLFIFGPAPTPFIGDLRRFLAPFFPLALIANHEYFSKKKLFIGLVLLSTAVTVF